VKELELNILKYFFQYKSALDYIEHGVGEEVFTDAHYRGVCHVYLKYIYLYKSLPDRGNLVTFMQQEGVTAEVISALNITLNNVYTPLVDTPFIESHLLKHLKKLLHTRAIQESLERLGDDWEEKDVTKVYKKLSLIDGLDVHKRPEEHFFLRDWDDKEAALPIAHPTCFQNFNTIIGRGGFYAPQLICILKGPKSMGTTFLIHLALGYIKSGLNVVYIDWENGLTQYNMVAKQALSVSRAEYLYENHSKEVLDRKKQELLSTNTDIHYIKLNKKSAPIAAAEILIDRHYDKTGIKPDVIFYDYLDIAGGDKSLRNKNERIQQIYADASNLNQKYNAFGITVSKVVKSALENTSWTEADAGEDSEKAYNVDAMFGLHRHDQEVEQGLGYLEAIVQRVGESHSAEIAVLEMDGATRDIRDTSIKYTPL